MAFTSIFNQVRTAAQKLAGGAAESNASQPAQSQSAASTRSSAPPVPPRPADTAAGMPPLPQLRVTSGPAIRGLEWLGVGKTIRMGKGALELHDPLSYFCVDELPPREQEPAAINLRLPIAAQVQAPADSELSHRPRYNELTTSQRRIYLDWLASGRKAVPPEPGYVFLFICGLERRALVEQQDIKIIFKEVFRLRQIYHRSGHSFSQSFDNYALSFLWFLLVRDSSVFAMRHFEVFAKSSLSWSDDRLAAALSWLAQSNQPLPDWLAFILAEQMPKSQRSVVAKRVGHELRELFLKRYREQHGAGMLLKISKRDREFYYRPVSTVLSPFESSGPNPLGLSSQFNVLSTLWNECIIDLKRLSSAVANSTGDAMTVQTWQALPAELRTGVDHPLTDQFSQFIEQHTGDSTLTIVPARALATLVGISPDAKLTTAACRRMAEAVADVGYCVEPDVRIMGRSYEDDEPIVLFLNLDDGRVEASRYAPASIMLCVGLALAATDGRTCDGELSLLTQEIDSGFELNEHERRRLGMLRELRLAKGTELSDVAKPLKNLSAVQRDRVAKFALALVAADGVVTKGEIKAIHRLYSAMGFDRDQADSALRALIRPADSDEPVTVLPAIAGAPGEAISPPPTKVVGLKLDRTAIAAILKDTLEVSRMLAEAMNIETEHVDQAMTAVASDQATVSLAEVNPSAVIESIVDPTMPARYAAFYQVVVTRSQWSRTELAALAKQHDLMLAGAVEAINDWSTEKHGGPILYEDDQHFTLEAAFLN